MNTRQNGSIVSYVLIGIVLLGLVAGAVTMVRQRSVASGDAKPVAVSPSPSPSTSPSGGTKTPSSSPSPTPSSVPTPSASPAPSVGARVPAAGPQEFVGLAVGLVALTAALASYVASQRRLSQAYTR